MLQINKRNRVFGEEIHKAVESKNKNYRDWLNDKLDYADLVSGKDFFGVQLESTGGRPKTQFEFTIDAAKEICLLERNDKGKQVRRWLIGLSNKAETLELIDVKQAAFAFKVINVLKYIDNQKEALSMHRTTYIEDNDPKNENKFIYSEFAKYRAKLTGWDKQRTDQAISEYLDNHSGYNRSKVMAKDMSTKISIFDTGEAIRIAVLDVLFSKHEDSELAKNFSVLCKNLATEMKVEIKKENGFNLFQKPEKVKDISIKVLK